MTAYLVLRARETACAVPLSAVLETMRPRPVEPLREAPSFVLGISIVRGRPVPVADLRVLIGLIPESPPERFVSLRIDDRRCALAADEVLGVRELDAAVLEGLPPLLSGAGAAMIAAIGALDRRLLLVLQAGRMIPDDVWRTVPRAGGVSP